MSARRPSTEYEIVITEILSFKTQNIYSFGWYPNYWRAYSAWLQPAKNIVLFF